MKFFAILFFWVASTLAAQTHALPESAVLIALGHDSRTMPLEGFANQIQEKLDRRVVTYRKFEAVQYVSETGKWWSRLPYEQSTRVVESAIRKAIERFPNERVIAFRLDGYSPSELFGPSGAEVQSYTNFEVRLLLRDRRLFLATRWYRNGRELTLSEAKKYWAPIKKRLNNRPSVLPEKDACLKQTWNQIK